MKRITASAVLAAGLAAIFTASPAPGQAIDAYRPSVVTYYPTTGAAPAGQQPFTTVSAAKLIGGTPVVPASHIVGSPVHSSYYGGPLHTAGYAPAPVCYPAAHVAYAQPVGAVPFQPIAAPPAGTIDHQYYVGRGLLGRPKVFKHSQPVRNALRRILP